MKFLVPNYSCLQNPWLEGYRPQITVLSVLNWICWTPTNKLPGYATGRLCSFAWLNATAHTRANNRPEQIVRFIVQFSSFFCFLNTATTRLCGRIISCHLMASLRDNKLSRSSWHVKVFTATIKEGALAGDVTVPKVLLPLALLQHDGKTLHYKLHTSHCND